MDGRTIWTDCDRAEDYFVPKAFSPRDIVSSTYNMYETVPHTDGVFSSVFRCIPHHVMGVKRGTEV